jgi:hypothetical protein
MEKTILSFGLMAVMAIGLVSMKGTGRPGAVADSGRPVMTRVLAGAVVDTVPMASGKRPGAVKAPVAMIDTLDASAAMIDSMSAMSVGPNGVTITFSATHISAQNAATMAGAVMTIANPKSATTAPVAVVGEPVAPVTTVMIVTDEPAAPVTAIAIPKAAPIAPMTALKTPMAATIAPPTDIKTPVAGVADPETGITGPTVTTDVAAPVPAVHSNGGGETIESIVTDLKAKGFVKKDGSLSFRLDGHGLKVNGVRQPAEVFQAFKDKFVGSAKVTYDYSHREGSTRSSVSVSED